MQTLKDLIEAEFKKNKVKQESRLDKDGTPVAELTPESTKLKEQSMNPMDLYLNAIESGVGVLTTTQEVVESVKAKQELDEAKIPVQHATDAVHGVLGQSGTVRFLNHLRPGTEKHTSWDKVNDALTKQGVKSQHIADIASKLKPAQYKEEVELDDEEAEREAKFKAALAATDHVAKGGMQKKGFTGSTYNPQKKVQKEEVGLDETMTELQKKVAMSKLASRNSARRSRINTSGTHNEKLAQQKDDIAKQKKYNEEVELDEAEDWELKKIHGEYKHLKSLPTSDVLKKHKAQNRVSASYSAAEMGGKEGLISDIMRNRHGQKRMDAYHSLPKKHKDALSEEAELDEAMKPLPRRHFFQSYGVEGHGIAHDGKENHWKFENNKPVAHTKDPEVVAGWKRDLAAKSRANEEVELDEVSQELASKVFKKRQAQAVDKAKDGNFMSPEGKKATQTLNRIGNKFGVNAVDKLTNEETELDEEQKIRVSDIKAALKNVKNASDHTKKMIKANPTQKMPHDSSRHAAYSEETKLTFAQFITQMSEAAKVKDKDVITSGKNKIALHQGEEDGSRVAEETELAESNSIVRAIHAGHIAEKDTEVAYEAQKGSSKEKAVNKAIRNSEKTGERKVSKDVTHTHYTHKSGQKFTVIKDRRSGWPSLGAQKLYVSSHHASKVIGTHPEDIKESVELDDIIESILGDKNDGAYKAGHQPKGRVVKGKSYGAEYNDDEDEKKAAPSGEKRGRGRPKKGADQSGEVKKYNFHDLLNRLSR